MSGRRRGSADADAPSAPGGRRRRAGGPSAVPRGRVAVVRGGASLERNVSLRSGGHVQETLRRLGYDTVAIDPGPDFVEKLEEERVDVAFVALHGGAGEDGTVQELLEALGIPYTGSGPGACMRCADKALAKFLMRDAG